jgi:signal transduction histidine kinase
MRLRRWAVDAGIVAALAAATAGTNRWLLFWPVFDPVGNGIKAASPPPSLGLWWLATVIGLASMLLRGAYPLVALAGSVGMSLVHLTVAAGVVDLSAPLLAAAPIAMYAVASRSTRRLVSCAALACAAGLLCVPRLLHYPPLVNGDLHGSWLLPPAAVAVGWLLGEHSRTRQAYLRQARQRADDLEREREQHAQLVAAAERARITRELHDVVAHSLSIIVLQAHAGAAELDQSSHPTHAALATIAATGRQSLAEMRRLLGLTRPDAVELAPLPDLGDLPDLVERIRGANLPVRLSVSGECGALAGTVQLTAYRIVQEALTNALRHAGPGATAEVTIHCAPSAVDITVIDTGRGAGGPAPNQLTNGLRGMRERADMLGGTFAAGNRPGGGFQVHATLPTTVDDPARSPEPA